MSLFKLSLSGILWVVVIALGLTGCGSEGKPYDYKPTAGEMKEGPGVFTGESGEFTVYDSKKGGVFWKQSQEQQPGTAGASGTETPASSAESGTNPPVANVEAAEGSPITPEEAREYQEFQEWKNEKRAFQEFQEWKKSAAGSAEYKEFREWQEFKTYQEWKKKKGQ